VRHAAVATAVSALLVTACGGAGRHPVDALRACVAERVPASAVAHVVTSTEGGVTTLIYSSPRGEQTTVSVFRSAGDASAALEAEARIGDAHDRRAGNVLYDGGGAVAAAVARCAG